jgi:hypothetical protein
MDSPLLHHCLTELANLRHFKMKGKFLICRLQVATVTVGWAIGRNTGSIVIISGLIPLDVPDHEIRESAIVLDYHFGAHVAADMDNAVQLELFDDLVAPKSCSKRGSRACSDYVVPELQALCTFAETRESLLDALYRGTVLNPQFRDQSYRRGFLTPLVAYQRFGFDLPDFEELGWEKPIHMPR